MRHSFVSRHRGQGAVMRQIAVLIVAWTLTGVPALCLAGVLAHECACGEEEAQVGCAHEFSCESDPCSEFVMRQDESGWDLLDGAPLAAPSIRVSDPASAVACDCPQPYPPRQRHGRPYPPSDLPLLS